MRFRITLTFLLLATALACALPAWARQKSVAPTLWPAWVCSGALRAPTAVRDRRYNNRGADLKVSATTAGTSPGVEGSPSKPFTREQVESMVRDGFGDESGAKLIEQRGIDFAPSEDLIQTLKAAGASEAFLNALRAAKPPEPASARKPINQVQVFALLVGQVPSHRVTMLVQERGIDFEPTDDYLQEVRLAGGEDELISALKTAKVTKPATVDPAAEARQVEVRQHVARGAEFFQKSQYASAEAEYRAAALLDPQNSNLHVALSRALSKLRKFDEALAEARESVRLSPNNEMAHYSLGAALGGKGDRYGETAEYREAVRLNPNSDMAHLGLGNASADKTDWDVAIAEYREALRLNPSNDSARVSLSRGLAAKGDLDGAIAESREALRLNPNNDMAHSNLGGGLGVKGDWDGAIAEEREALRLNPNNDLAHSNLGFALDHKGELDDAIAEEREALRLNPNNQNAHNYLGWELGEKGDWDGMIAEARQALRLNPNDSLAHFCVGVALEKKGDPRGALEEYRTAYTLDPKDADYKQNYERLLRQIKH